MGNKKKPKKTMKFGFALLAAGAAALRTETEANQDWSCYGPWYWEECSGYYWQSDYCMDDCGWWYSPGEDDWWGDDFWVSCDEFASWEECNGGVSDGIDWSCYGPWIWEECSGYYWQSDYCMDDCGWWYSPEEDDWWGDDWWVSCDEFASWDFCQVGYDDGIDWSCYGPWIWEDCSGYYWQSDYCTDACGWWYSPDEDDDWSDDWWVSCDEFATWDYCWW